MDGSINTIQNRKVDIASLAVWKEGLKKLAKYIYFFPP